MSGNIHTLVPHQIEGASISNTTKVIFVFEVNTSLSTPDLYEKKCVMVLPSRFRLGFFLLIEYKLPLKRVLSGIEIMK